MIPVSILTGRVSNGDFVACLSLWAPASGHRSAWQPARVEVDQQEDAERRSKEDVAGDVVERMVQETTSHLNRASPPLGGS